MEASAVEGFLCPVCLKDFGDTERLLLHSQTAHRQPVKNTIKGFEEFFEKARQKFVKNDLWAKEFDEPTPGTLKYVDSTDTNQEIGFIRKLTVDLKRDRDMKIDYVAVETNKLLIRLDKLMNEMPSDISKRKAYEKQVIPWLRDSDAQKCSRCGIRFSLTRRKHHCRLCGKILCSGCSKFLLFTKARKMINPAYALAYENEADEIKKRNKEGRGPLNTTAEEFARKLSVASSSINFRQAERLLMTGISKFKGDGSEVSVNSFYSQDDEEHLRICSVCSESLNRRDQQTELRTKTPYIVQIYDRLKSLIDEAVRLYSSFCKMCQSLNEGESRYDLQSARELRFKIENLIQQIGYMSEKFSSLPKEETGNDDMYTEKPALHCREIILLKNIQCLFMGVVRDIVYNMPKLPDSDQYAALQQEFQRKLEMKINEERMALPTVKLKTAASVDSFMRIVPSKMLQPNHGAAKNESWVPIRSDLHSSLSSFLLDPVEEDDPLRPFEEQIIVIKGFIQQATSDGRLEEIEILGRNLKDLQNALTEVAKKKEMSQKKLNYASVI